jgi:hypothetical protein
MSVAKIIEISAESATGFEDAVAQGIAKAGQSVKNIRGAWVKDQEVVVADGAIRTYRVNLKITFEIGG